MTSEIDKSTKAMLLESKKLILLYTLTLIAIVTVSATNKYASESMIIANYNRAYSKSFIFIEGGIEFSVFPDGQFDFVMQNYSPNVNFGFNTPTASITFNSGYDYNAYVQYDDYGAIIQIENTPVFYDYYGRVTQIGNITINYNAFGRINRLGGMYVHYNRYRIFSHYTGFINTYNRSYVYRPWHNYYVLPPVNYCVVNTRPYRQYYRPIRHHYYRPYTRNFRQPVRINGRRGSVANTTYRRSNRSNRYRQAATPRRQDRTVLTKQRQSRNRRVSSNSRSSNKMRVQKPVVRNSTPRKVTGRTNRSSTVSKSSTVRTTSPRTTTTSRTVTRHKKTPKAVKKYTSVRTPKAKPTRISRTSRTRTQIKPSGSRSSSQTHRSRHRTTRS